MRSQWLSKIEGIDPKPSIEAPTRPIGPLPRTPPASAGEKKKGSTLGSGKALRQTLSGHLRRFDSEVDSLDKMDKRKLNRLVVNEDGTVSPQEDRKLFLGVDSAGAGILVRESDSRRLWLDQTALKIELSSSLQMLNSKEGAECAIAMKQSRLGRNAIWELLGSSSQKKVVKQKKHNPAVFETVWAMRHEDYMNVKAEIVERFGEEVAERHKSLIRGFLQFLSSAEHAGANIRDSSRRMTRNESIPWLGMARNSTVSADTPIPTTTADDVPKSMLSLKKIRDARQSLRRSIWLDRGAVRTRSSSGFHTKKLSSDLDFSALLPISEEKPAVKSVEIKEDDAELSPSVQDTYKSFLPHSTYSASSLSPPAPSALSDEENDDDFFSEGALSLGTGINGSTRLYRSKSGSTLYAVKSLDLVGSENRKQVVRELATLLHRRSSVDIGAEGKKKMSDDNGIVHLYGFHVEETRVRLILEFMDLAGLDRLTVKGVAISERTVAGIAWQIANSLRYLKERDLVHRDIKPANILWSTSGTVKLGDFGLAMRTNADNERSFVGTRLYISPERYDGTCSFPADIFAFGLVLVELLAGAHPVVPERESLSVQQLHLQIHRAMEKDIRVPSGLEISEEGRTLLHSMLRLNPEQRPNASQILESDWFTKMRIKSLASAVKVVAEFANTYDSSDAERRTGACPVGPVYDPNSPSLTTTSFCGEEEQMRKNEELTRTMSL